MGNEESVGFAAVQIYNVETGIARRLRKIRYRE